MGRSYQHLSDQERAAIMIQAGDGQSARAIARSLGRHVATISRELARGRTDVGSYCATRAAAAYRQARRRSGRPRKLVPGTWLHQWVQDRLCLFRRSPEQIAGRLRRRVPEQPSRHVSYETIYAAIYARPRASCEKR